MPSIPLLAVRGETPRRGGRAARGWALAALLAASLLVTGCDNPACVFGGNCFTGGDDDQLGTNPATIPPDHAWILTGAPAVTDRFPVGGAINSETPIALVFSESMAAQSLLAGVALFPAGGIVPVPTLPPALVADGRMLVVMPLGALDFDETYELRLAAQVTVTDLTGTSFSPPADRVLHSFTVASMDPAPRVLTTWPADGARDQSATGEVVVVFDRTVNQPGQVGSVNSQSFVIKAGNVVPNPNPPPQPVLLVGAGAFPTTDTRVWQYRKADGMGNAVSLGAGLNVTLETSPAGDLIEAESGGFFPSEVRDFDVASFSAPLSAEFVHMPTDAIGIENLDGDMINDVDLAVTMDAGLPTDQLGIFLFGRSPDPNSNDLITLFREVGLGGLGFDPMVSPIVTLTEGQLNIASSANPVNARFADGQFAIALRVERGGKLSPVRMVDVDMVQDGVQHALIDTTRPTFTAFGSTGNEDMEFASDLRHLAVCGRASEEIRSVEVAALATSNGSFPDVIGADGSGLFVAAPLNLGVVDPGVQPLDFTMEIYDRALNSTQNTIAATFEQRGVVGPGTPLPGAPMMIDVEVFDDRTLRVIEGATVFIHDDNAGVVTSVDWNVTGPTGRLMLLAGAAETIVTVEAPGYDNVSYHGVPVSRISLPMRRNTLSPGAVLGTISSTNADIGVLDLAVSDSRQFEFDTPIPKNGCSFNFQTLSTDCGYGDVPIRLGPPRVVSVVAEDVPPPSGLFAARSFLRGFGLQLPVAAPSGGANSIVDFRLDELLDDPDVSVEEWAIDLLEPLKNPPQVPPPKRPTVSTVGLVGVDPMDLVGDPQVTLEARVRSMHGAALVGSGLARDPVGTPAAQWTVYGAYPGIVDPIADSTSGDLTGELVSDGIIDPDLFLSVEVRDTAGNRAGRRLRFPSSVLDDFVLFDATRITSPAGGGNTGGEGFAVLFEDRINTFGGGQAGIYRMTLVDTAGKAWTLYRASGAGASRRISVPDLPAVMGAGGIGLSDGLLGCAVEAWAWTGFNESSLLFSDIEREHDRFSESAAITFTKP